MKSYEVVWNARGMANTNPGVLIIYSSIQCNKVSPHESASKGGKFFQGCRRFDVPLLYKARTYIGLSKGQKYGV
ncbi:hypothetical protein [Cytobacillus oceanisediminis]|uniref:hypothetical protein n=1 Tax=Cytobacillus oceanisediminis TaxID=665099 RepID=UPI00203FA79B|nr:hypothetical protein [Cytobacillus oceanisediminis]MCM3400960.1 hypothetical protein [Cytobacillus oceanisediminis]